MTVRIAVIGAGIMGSDHARIFAEEIPGAKVIAICDASRERAEVLSASLGGAEVLTDPMSAISHPEVDALVIASPDVTHAPLSLACVRAGKRVLCEKPLSQSSAECLTVLQAEQAAGARFVQLGFMRRYDEAYMQMKAAVDNGRLGRALMMHNFHRNVETPASDFTGAMAITNSAPHEFDMVRHILGTEYASISATQPKRSDTLVAPVFMVLETVDGQVVTIEINNNAAYGYDVRAELVGEAASIALNPVAYTRLDAALTTGTAYDADWRSRYHQAYVRQNRAFLRFVQTGVFPEFASSAWDGYASTIVAEAGVRALTSSQKTSVTLITKPEIYS